MAQLIDQQMDLGSPIWHPPQTLQGQMTYHQLGKEPEIKIVERTP